VQYSWPVPFFLFGTVCGFHSLIELIDVISFIYILRSFTLNNYDTTTYMHGNWISSDIREMLFILLTMQMLIWLVPMTFVTFYPEIKHDHFKTCVLVFSMLVEITTDLPELVILVLWGGWRGHGSFFLISAMIFDIIMTGKSILFNPVYYQLCSCCDDDEHPVPDGHDILDAAIVYADAAESGHCAPFEALGCIHASCRACGVHERDFGVPPHQHTFHPITHGYNNVYYCSCYTSCTNASKRPVTMASGSFT